MNKLKKFIINKRNILLTTIGVLIVILASLSVTYSFMTVLPTGDNNSSVGAQGDDLNTLNFAPGAPLLIEPGDDNFGTGQGNVHMTSNPTVTFAAVGNDRNITANYYVYFEVVKNDYIYTTDTNNPELILTILDPSGNEITELDGLTHVTVGSVTGFDVTMYEGSVAVALNQEISLTGSETTKTDTWTIRLTMINLDTNQSANSSSTFNANIIMQKLPRSAANPSSIILEHNGGIAAIDAKSATYTKVPLDKDYYVTLPSSLNDPALDKANTVLENGMFSHQEGSDSNPLTTYYFRGYVDNNWVSFGGFYWRIIRINGDGSIRMIYSGINPPTEMESHVKLGTDTYIHSGVYNNVGNLSEHVGFKYVEGEAYGTTTPSYANSYLETWFIDNLLAYEDYIADSIFYNDRGIFVGSVNGVSRTGTAFGTEHSWYISAYKLNQYPEFYSPTKASHFTANNDSENTNDSLNYPVGLLDANEAVLAGTILGINNTSNYLYNGYNYWTMTPYGYDGVADVFIVNSSGALAGDNVTDSNYYRPVINIKSNALLTGTGKWNDPYVVTGLE